VTAWIRAFPGLKNETRGTQIYGDDDKSSGLNACYFWAAVDFTTAGAAGFSAGQGFPPLSAAVIPWPSAMV
jgi:hypothetical protein